MARLAQKPRGGDNEGDTSEDLTVVEASRKPGADGEPGIAERKVKK
ncbi:MAG: hypothetical protein Q6373_001430 [Candidatus Sigynarchaeota archaeon]